MTGVNIMSHNKLHWQVEPNLENLGLQQTKQSRFHKLLRNSSVLVGLECVYEWKCGWVNVS